MSSNFRESLVRQQDLIPFNKLSTQLTIVGAGAIGSMASIALAKMGFVAQTVYDFDEVDIVNMNCQGFGFKHIGMSKVDALRDLYSMFSALDLLSTHNEKFTSSNKISSPIMICALDSMAGRKEILESCLLSGTKWLIDPRTSIQYSTMYVVDLHDKDAVNEYKKTLYSDEEAVQEPCTMKATSFVSYITGGMVAKVVKDLVVDGKSFKVMHFDIGANDCVFV